MEFQQKRTGSIFLGWCMVKDYFAIVDLLILSLTCIRKHITRNIGTYGI